MQVGLAWCENYLLTFLVLLRRISLKIMTTLLFIRGKGGLAEPVKVQSCGIALILEALTYGCDKYTMR
jgi:hypothetical protein